MGPFVMSDVDEDGLRVMRVRFRSTQVPKLATAYKLMGVARAIARLRRRGWVPDVVHAHEYTAGRPALVAARLSGGAPLVVSEHASDVALGRLTARQITRARQTFHAAAIVAPVSDDLGHRLQPLAGATPVVPVPNPVDTDLFHPGARHPDQQLRLLTVGNLVEIKGHNNLIEALRIVADAGLDARLDIAGDGGLREPLARRAHELAVADRVTFHGHLPRRRVAALMRTADVFVLPSLYESLPCVLAETMASGVPCVATAVGGVPELVNRGTGVLVEPGSPPALADGIRTVVARRTQYDPRVLHEVAVHRYGYRAVERSWSDVYVRALGVGRSGAGTAEQKVASHA